MFRSEVMAVHKFEILNVNFNGTHTRRFPRLAGAIAPHGKIRRTRRLPGEIETLRVNLRKNLTKLVNGLPFFIRY